jgi:hypothetical protein
VYAKWGRLELPARAPPLMELQVYAKAARARQEVCLSLFVLLLVGFHTWPRSGEPLATCRRDVEIDPRTGRGVIFLLVSESASRTGTQESVTVT